MDMGKYLFAFDIDGTLETGTREIDPELIKIIKTIQDNGNAVSLITGRLCSGSIDVAGKLDLVSGSFISGGDGGSFYIWNGKNNKPDAKKFNFLEKDSIVDILQEFNPPGIIMYENTIDLVGNVSGLIKHLARISTPDITTVSSWNEIDFSRSVTGLRFIVPTTKYREFINTMENYSGNSTEFFRGDDFDNTLTGISVRKQGIDKASALEYICTELNIDIGNTVSFGDWITDIPLLKRAKTGFCPVDAHDRVKNTADNVSLKKIQENWVTDCLSAFMNKPDEQE
ncbi:MAG: HAD-IIB family hydrolase [Deltaproteobacteria bacterium]|nr:HAD-IIB family hydrolase [Deltaproteobacteria bacterium]